MDLIGLRNRTRSRKGNPIKTLLRKAVHQDKQATMGGFGYTLGHKALAEFLACIFTCTVGEGLIANEHLPGTKGNGFGFGFIALGFGLSFAFSINMFGYISAHLNPAMCVCLWVAGKMTFEEVLVISAAETAGWFVGACIVFVLYMPHFATVPEPVQDVNQRAPMSTAVGRSAMQIASVQPTRDRVETSISYWARPDQLLRHRMRTTIDTDKRRAFVEEFGLKVMDDVEQFRRLPKDLPPLRHDETAPKLKRSKSIQIAVVHRALQEMDNHSQLNNPNHRTFKDDLAHLPRQPALEPVQIGPRNSEVDREEAMSRNTEEVKSVLQEEYLKAVHADQHVKLAVFATTPAIPNIFMNTIQLPMPTFFSNRSNSSGAYAALMATRSS
mmetsp:Transcript_119280/g.178197  ORF Transcript_119280/g.178197 Transcript_119280/m.178197 type:complete len:384 (+) Transcript_119280:3-1154(+)